MKNNPINFNLDINKLFTQIGNLFRKIKLPKRVNIKNLSNEELAILNKFYIEKLNEYTSIPVSISETNNGLHIINKLVERNIIQQMTYLERINAYTGSGVAYKLIPKAVKKLNKWRQNHELE